MALKKVMRWVVVGKERQPDSILAVPRHGPSLHVDRAPGLFSSKKPQQLPSLIALLLVTSQEAITTISNQLGKLKSSPLINLNFSLSLSLSQI